MSLRRTDGLAVRPLLYCQSILAASAKQRTIESEINENVQTNQGMIVETFDNLVREKKNFAQNAKKVEKMC